MNIKKMFTTILIVSQTMTFAASASSDQNIAEESKEEREVRICKTGLILNNQEAKEAIEECSNVDLNETYSKVKVLKKEIKEIEDRINLAEKQRAIDIAKSEKEFYLINNILELGMSSTLVSLFTRLHIHTKTARLWIKDSAEDPTTSKAIKAIRYRKIDSRAMNVSTFSMPASILLSVAIMIKEGVATSGDIVVRMDVRQLPQIKEKLEELKSELETRERLIRVVLSAQRLR